MIERWYNQEHRSKSEIAKLLNKSDNKIKAVVEGELKGYENILKKAKVMLKKNNVEGEIYRLSELEDGIILEDELEPIAHNTYAIRLWVDKDTTLPAGSNFHYHGKIKIIEEEI